MNHSAFCAGYMDQGPPSKQRIMREPRRSRLTVLAAGAQRLPRRGKISAKHLLVTALQSCILDMHSIRRLQEAAQQKPTARAIGQHVREDAKCTTVSQT